MPNSIKTPVEYISSLPEDRKKSIQEIRKVILKNLPKGFEETINYGMLTYVVPHTIYPKGYHCDPKLPLPFISLASQKNFIALYHMGIYADKELLKWFTEEYKKHTTAKLDMGKSCIRFKNLNAVPIDLIGKLIQKISLKDWIRIYETELQVKKK
jgi:uncharacterized protein YdhG (YjbR/CyaY superfamily)